MGKYGIRYSQQNRIVLLHYFVLDKYWGSLRMHGFSSAVNVNVASSSLQSTTVFTITDITTN